MSKVFKFTGLVNLLLFTVAILLLINQSENFSLKKEALSYLAGDSNSGVFFNFFLFLFALGQILFAYIINEHYKKVISPYILPSFYLSGFFLCIVALFSVNEYLLLHGIAANLSGFFSILGATLFTINIFQKNNILGLNGVVVILLIITSFILGFITESGFYEIPLFMAVIIWNIVLSWAIISPNPRLVYS